MPSNNKPAKTNAAPANMEEYGPAVMRMFDVCRTEATLDDDTSFGGLSIAERILSAESEEEIFAAANAGTKGGRDYIDRPFLLKEDDITIRESQRTDLDGGLIDPRDQKMYFGLLNVTDLETGNQETINTGSPSLLSTILALRDGGHMAKYTESGGMPLVIKGKPTANGTVLILSKAPGFGRAQK